MHWLSKLIFFKILGWDLENHFDPSIKKCVIIVAPHTSNFDFFIGLLVRKIMNIHIDFIGKKELFRPPYGWYFRMIGGSPVDRNQNQKKVDAIVQLFEEHEIFRLALSPEGTRKKVERWKTGFYFIAVKAKVPIIMASFDFRKKLVKISDPFWPTGNFDTDFARIKSYYEGVEGKIPENF
ncbi:acyltransferase [Christiangramia fulva]|uniref:Acyltransferase n=1 Tax=Christiangramia fulva TaxID=2126553 RepID=A0A2R3Z7M6_9FLAO|nr:1-acyl-sn-glycerol-3-phosphate acyltransferase [Christiangramia fulva]AVR46279.1 acyltransferase [Christiangramia fulva]